MKKFSLIGLGLIVAGGIVFSIGYAKADQSITDIFFSRNMDKTYTKPVKAYDKISAYGNINLTIKSGGKFSITSTDSKDHPLEYKVQNNTLELRQDNNESSFSTNFQMGELSRLSFVTVTVPSHQLTKVDGLDNRFSLKIKHYSNKLPMDITGWGNVKIKDANAKSIRVRGIEDRVSVVDSTFNGDASQIYAGDNYVDLHNSSFKSLFVKTTTGDVNVDRPTIESQLSVITDTGNIFTKLKKSEDAKIEVKTSGPKPSVKTATKAVNTDKRYRFKSNTGTITVLE
ncbi:DUF4097 family beta strand repeat-containing protein [Apilactobacillus kunkeei]|uniref:DUF4097 family beta strand repeat-containing protein n=1 Tax=Apilactobacillus kunkeei TaxID=148814 RepID=UPI0015E8345B|nr:DUF4097 family beta strand repeat-containing protein [Apilactobacillus kunkeei]